MVKDSVRQWTKLASALSWGYPGANTHYAVSGLQISFSFSCKRDCKCHRDTDYYHEYVTTASSFNQTMPQLPELWM